MEILKDIELIDLGLYIKESKTLVIADLHLGYEESLNKKGVFVPRLQFKDIYLRLEKMLAKIKTETIVITGDLKHEFGVIRDTEWKNIFKLIDLFLKHSKNLIIIKGNHDVTLPWITRKKGIELVEYYKIGDILICHGDEILNNEDFNKSKIIIIGHEHPAIGLKEKSKYESYKCFLKGKYSNKILIVLPSFHTLTTGTDVLRSRLLSPFLQGSLGNFEAYIIENNKIYKFDKLKSINK